MIFYQPLYPFKENPVEYMWIEITASSISYFNGYMTSMLRSRYDT